MSERSATTREGTETDAGILILRLVLGLTMAAHGAQKLFGWFGGPGFGGTAGFLEQMGFRPGRLHAALTSGSELGGGLLLALGLLTPLGAAAVIGSMVAAVASAHRGKGFFVTRGGSEYNLLLIACALAIAFAGPGRFSLDRAAGWAVSGAPWGLAAAVVGLITALGVVATRQRPQPSDASSEGQRATT